MSAESGIRTFRDSGGLWEGYDVMEVASVNGWHKNRALVLDFYNQRRNAMHKAAPNAAHLALAGLEAKFQVEIITQNVDNLHERAGSSSIIHLHGELTKSRSTAYPFRVYTLDKTELNLGDFCENGHQLRPHIVWFGEEVPEMSRAIDCISTAELLVIIGTSMAVYPAASLIHYAPPQVPVFYIDPKTPEYKFESNVVHIKKKAVEGMQVLINQHLNSFNS